MKLPRLQVILIITAAALLAGMAFSIDLWFALDRSFPRAPMLFDPGAGAKIIERILSAAVVLALTAAIALRSRRTAGLAVAVVALVLLALLDQNRMQPWVYLYTLIFSVIMIERDEDRAIGLVQLLIAGLYVWSGVQKLNFSFGAEVLPLMFGVEAVPPAVALGIAVSETLIGIGLLMRRTRNLAVIAGTIMHCTILVALISMGHNQIVWLWNIALIALLFAAFWKSELSLREVFKSPPIRNSRIARSIVIAAVALPILSFAGLWDMYLSGALYSGNVKTAVIGMNDAAYKQLSPSEQRSVVLGQGGAKLLPLFEWAIADMNVPVYPQDRVFASTLDHLCYKLAPNARMELILRERPNILTGASEITRVYCGDAR